MADAPLSDGTPVEDMANDSGASLSAASVASVASAASLTRPVPGVAEGTPVPSAGVALSDDDVRRAEREAFLFELDVLLNAIVDLSNETLAFAGILVCATTFATSGLAALSVISAQFYGASVHACAVIHPVVTGLQLLSLWLCIVTGSSQMRAYYRLDFRGACALQISLFMYEFFFLFALVTPHTLLEQRPVLSSAHCSVDRALGADSQVPLQSLAVAVFAVARFTILGLLWLIGTTATFAYAVRHPANLPGLVCLHGAAAVFVMKHTISYAGCMNDALVFLVASADEIAMRCARALINYYRPVELRASYEGSTFGPNVFFTEHASTLRLALHHPATPVILAIVSGMLGFSMAAAGAQARKLRRQRAHGRATVVGERAN